MGFSVSILIGVLVLVVALAIFERIIRAAPRRWYRRAASSGPVCGACGHPAMLREATRCPECGDTYAHAGVFTRALEVRTGPPFVTTAVTGVLGSIVLGLLAMGTVMGLGASSGVGGGIQGRLEQRQGFTPNATWNATARPAPRYTFQVVHEGLASGPPTANTMPTNGTVTLRILGAPDTGAIAVYDMNTNTWTLTDAGGTLLDSGNDLADGAEALLRTSGLDNAWDGSARELQDARAIAHAAMTTVSLPAGAPSSNTFGLSRTSSGLSFAGGSPTGAPPGVLILAIVAGAAPLLGTIAWLIVMGVRRQRDLIPAQEPNSAPVVPT
ncbi:MAG: hypothetical protein Tsb0013_20140 [Phycisphaerales bacterium]